ncbi:hypothetical protein Ocin01_16866 [Orchesella cincta]|uniref:Uncharacterized protein n=1 Tax=Orchesella cincta TaxID=48709 RepID=A0A1D2MAA2_ORCCI|nr:hypothetical protein Ocin01_16866 [Orchesella cincta]
MEQSYDKLLRLKIASEIVLGNQAAVAFSRAFYLEDVLIERVHREFLEVSRDCQVLLDQVQKFIHDVVDDDSSKSNLSPLSESNVRCQCSEMLESLGTNHQPLLESFQQKLIQAKARRQAKSCLLEKLSTQNNNISMQFTTMTLAELITDVNIPEFSCFINDSDFGILEKLVEEWDNYREKTKQEFDSCRQRLLEFRMEAEKAVRVREYTCDMILQQITQQNKHSQVYSSGTLKKRGVFHKFSTLLRRRHTHQVDMLSQPHEREQSPSQLSVATNNLHQQTF